MKRIGQSLGKVSFISTYPLTLLALRGSHRSRVFIYNNSGEILVLKTWHGMNKWGLPGGGIKKDENPGQGASREIAEELGIKIVPKLLKFVKTIEYNHLGIRMKLSLFTVHFTDQPSVRLGWHEISEAQWIKPDQLNKRNSTYDLLLCLKSLLQ